MTPSSWKFPVLACALGIVGSCTASRTNLPVRASMANSPVVAVAIKPPVMVGTIDPATIILDTDLPDIAGRTNLTATANAPMMATTNPSTANMENSLPPFDQQVLDAHNRERLALGLKPLSWNSILAWRAQRWADYLAATGRFEHAPENRLAPEGENLWAGTKGYYTPEAQVDAWIREKRFFRPGLFPDNSITGRVEDIGHYTQVVWRATTEVGCGEATSAREAILVCRYVEAGNYRGEQPF
jgi:hypothetical protein